MEDIKYINLVEIGLVVFELWEVEIGDFSIRVNNTSVLHATFLTAQHMTVCLNICIYFPFTDILKQTVTDICVECEEVFQCQERRIFIYILRFTLTGSYGYSSIALLRIWKGNTVR